MDIDKDTTKNDLGDMGADDDVQLELEDVNAIEIVKKIREKLKKCELEKQEYLTGWQRAQADSVNARKQEEKDRLEFVKFAGLQAAKSLIPVLDSFDLAFANRASWEATPKEWRTGIERIYSQLLQVLELQGITLDNPESGEIFDPVKHESAGLVKTERLADDQKIVEVFQKGYLLHGKILRPARVKVFEYVQ